MLILVEELLIQTWFKGYLHKWIRSGSFIKFSKLWQTWNADWFLSQSNQESPQFQLAAGSGSSLSTRPVMHWGWEQDNVHRNWNTCSWDHLSQHEPCGMWRKVGKLLFAICLSVNAILSHQFCSRWHQWCVWESLYIYICCRVMMHIYVHMPLAGSWEHMRRSKGNRGGFISRLYYSSICRQTCVCMSPCPKR